VYGTLIFPNEMEVLKMSSQVKNTLIIIGVIVAVVLAIWSYKKTSGPSVDLSPKDLMESKSFNPPPGAAPIRP